MLFGPPPPVVIAQPDPVRELAVAIVAMTVGILLALILRPSQSAYPSASEASAEKSKGKSVRSASDVGAKQLQQLLESRRSIQPKNFTGGSVAQSAVRAILEAAPWAPNHGKTEPWRFTVFAGEAKAKLLDLTRSWYAARPDSFWETAFVLASTGKPEFPDFKAFAEYYDGSAVSKWSRASHLITICVRRQRNVEGKKQFPEWEENAAVACAVQNMHLMATSLGVGAYWSSWYAHYANSTQCPCDLGLDPDLGDRCLGVFVIGEAQPAVLAANRATRLPIDQIVRWEGA